jgi:uncharacterized protein
MKLQLSPAGSDVHFTGYGEGYVTVNGERYTHHLLLVPGRGVEPWNVEDFPALAAAHFEALVELGPEIVVLGTGGRMRFPHPRLTRALPEAGIGLEVMDTAAACRTCNILLSEGRKVVAAILLDPA